MPHKNDDNNNNTPIKTNCSNRLCKTVNDTKGRNGVWGRFPFDCPITDNRPKGWPSDMKSDT